MTFIDFFAGIGGFRLGMEQAGHTCKGYIEIDKYAVKSYQAMHKTEGEFYANDIRTVRPEDLPESDCYCGGFPCQAFSVAGKRRGFEDMRGTLIFEVFRLAKTRKPKTLFLENVAGLLNHDGGRTFGTILSAMAELGYDAEWQCINSSSYVPQNRERIFIIGRLRGRSERKVFPFGGENKTALKQLVGGCQSERVYDITGISPTLDTMQGGNKQPKALVRPCLTPDRIEKRQNGRRFKEDGEPMFTLTGQDTHGILQLPRGKNKGGLHENISPAVTSNSFEQNNFLVGGLYTDCSPDFSRGVLPGLSRTLKANKNDAGVQINGRIRKLTPLECFRLQGFPDELFYKAQAVNSDSQLYKQAGNSVTVPVIYEIAKRL